MQFDTTYKKNRLNLPIVCYLVVDGHGKGRVVGYGILRDETLQTVEACLECIKTIHKRSDELKTILIDKAMVEIVAIKDVFPGVRLHICLFHSAKLLLDNCKHAPDAVKDEVQVVIECMMYKSYTREDYMKYYQEFILLIPDEENELRRWW